MQDNTAIEVKLSGDILIDGLMSSVAWAQTALTYAFPTSFSQYGPTYAGSQFGAGFTAFSPEFQANVRYWLDQVSSVSLLSFSVGEPETATLRWGRFDDPNNLAYGFYPNSGDAGGDQWFANNNNLAGIPGDAQMHTILHELGHALGLKHPHDGSLGLPTEFDVGAYTAMSYNDYSGDGTQPGRYNRIYNDYPQSIPILDIAALQYLYGANFSYQNSSTAYQFDSMTGSLIVNGVNQGPVAGNNIFRSLWDGGGHDLYDFSGFGEDQVINLLPGEWSTFSRGQLASNSFSYSSDGTSMVYHYEPGNIVNPLLYKADARSLIEDVRTGRGNDLVTGNAAANVISTGEGNDHIEAGSGSDTLLGGPGADVLIGGPGADLMDGGDGSDTYEVGDARDVVREAIGHGTDKVFGYIDYTLTDNVENLDMSFGSQIYGHGNASDNLIIGNLQANSIAGFDGNDRLEGGSGNDAMDGGNGNDVLLGGTGADIMIGGQGSDIYEVDSSVDVVFEQAGAGIADNVYAYVDFSIPDNVENLIMLYGNQRFGTGSAGGNIIIGNGQSNVIEGGAGYDTLIGGGGSDLFIVRAGFGVDVITDFRAGAGSEDAVLFSRSLFNDFSQVMANSAQVGADTWIGDGFGNTVVLVGIQQSSLHANDFGFI